MPGLLWYLRRSNASLADFSQVNIGSGRKSLIVLRDGDDPATVAASFSRESNFSPTAFHYC